MRHRANRLGTLTSLFVVGLLAIWSSSALALETHPFTGSFGPEGPGLGTFSRVEGVAVDQANELVYVYDGPAGKVYKFDLAGDPVPFSSTGTNVIEPVGGSPEKGAVEIAVAPPGAPGGSAGDIYVATNLFVAVYSSAGEELGFVAGSEPCGVATNPAGHVFVGVYGPPNKVREYVPIANPLTEEDLKASSTAALPEICNVAADGLGNVYAANYEGSQGVVKLEGLNAATATPVDPTAYSIAVDPGNNDLYAAAASGFRQYSPSGNLISVSGTERLSGAQGIAVDSASETIYVGNESNHQVDVFGPFVVKTPGAKSNRRKCWKSIPPTRLWKR